MEGVNGFLNVSTPQKKTTCHLKNSGKRRLFGGHISFPGCIPFRLGKVCVLTASRNLGQPYICLGSLNYRSHSHVVIFNPRNNHHKNRQIWIIRSPPEFLSKTTQLPDPPYTSTLSNWPYLWCHEHHWVVIHRSEPHSTVLLASSRSLDV